MKEYLQKFLAIKTVCYVIAFGVLTYGIFIRKHEPIIQDNLFVIQSGSNTICFDKNCFDIEIANTPAKREA